MLVGTAVQRLAPTTVSRKLVANGPSHPLQSTACWPPSLIIVLFAKAWSRHEDATWIFAGRQECAGDKPVRCRHQRKNSSVENSDPCLWTSSGRARLEVRCGKETTHPLEPRRRTPPGKQSRRGSPQGTNEPDAPGASSREQSLPCPAAGAEGGRPSQTIRPGRGRSKRASSSPSD